MAPVNDTRRELTLPLTLSLSDFGIYFAALTRQRRAPNTKKQGDYSPIAPCSSFVGKSPIPKDGCASAMDCAKTL